MELEFVGRPEGKPMQVRAETTRRVIVDAAVALFDRIGYANVSLADLIAATGFSKGAFYYHFVNREAVTTAIIAEADETLQRATREILSDSSAPALANLIRAFFEIAQLTRNNSLVRVGVQLRGGVTQLSTAMDGFVAHRDLFTDVVATAQREGEVRGDLNVQQVGHTLWTAVLGTHQHCDATAEDLSVRLADVMTILLPAICTPDAARAYSALVAELGQPLANVG